MRWTSNNHWIRTGLIATDTSWRWQRIQNRVDIQVAPSGRRPKLPPMPKRFLKLSEVFQAVVLARLPIGAMAVFALFVNNPTDDTDSKSHIAMGASEEIATSLCALATVGIDAEIVDADSVTG